MTNKIAGANGPDYKGLKFVHKFDHYNEDEGEGRIEAHHPEHGKIGGLSYSKLFHDPDSGFASHMIHIENLTTHPEHKRRGVASQLMNELERKHPDTPIDHGTRTPAGRAWADAHYGPTEYHDDDEADPSMGHHEPKYPTLNGKYVMAGLTLDEFRKKSQWDSDELWCTACSGTGEQGTGHECYQCDGTGKREDQNPDIDNSNPANGLIVGRNDKIGQNPVLASIHRREVVRKHLASLDKVGKMTERVAVLVREAVVDEWIKYDLPSMVRIAHVSGNQVDILHCPFCGSGSLVARSDGTCECGFCTAVFTVQVQPQYSAFPQTVEGQPYPWPGRPNEDGQVSPDLPGGDDQIGGDPIDGGMDDEGGDDFGDEAEDESDDKDDDTPDFLKKSYRTAKGNLLDIDKYLDHLAITHAKNRRKVVESVRGSH